MLLGIGIGGAVSISYAKVVNGFTKAHIDTAISLANDGETVYFPPGEYLIDAVGGVVVSGKTNLTLYGPGAVFISDDIDYTHRLHGDPMLYLDDCISCSIVGLKFDGTGTTGSNNVSAILVEDSTDTLIEYCEAWGMNSNLSFGEGNCNRNIWSNCISRDSRAGSSTRGFWLGNANSTEFTANLTVVNCKAFGNTYTGFVMFSDGGKIENCYSYNNGGSGIITPGTSTYIVKNILIIGNHCENNSFYGIQQDPTGAGGLFDVNITGNACIGNTNGGILIVESENTIVSSNLIKNNLGPGIEVDNNISGLVITGNIIVDDQGTSTQDDGIDIIAGTGVTMSDIIISDNYISGNSSHGIQLETTVASGEFNGVYIRNNVIKNNGAYGLFSANNGTVTNLKIENNAFSGNTTRDVRLSGANGQSGLRFANNIWDKDKSIFDQAKDGFHTAAPTAGTWAVNDRVYNSAPSASGTIGWVCVTAGSPGTWKTFGTIAS